MLEGTYNKVKNRLALTSLKTRPVMNTENAMGDNKYRAPIPVDIGMYNAGAPKMVYQEKTTTIAEAGGFDMSPSMFPRWGVLGGIAE